MNLHCIAKSLLFCGLVMGCSLAKDEQGFFVISQLDEFSTGLNEWRGDFADYPVEDSLMYELKFGHEDLPVNLGTGKALLLSGNNKNDDLFMFIKKRVRYLQPNTEYSVSFDISFVSNASKGSPGGNVFLKAGATAIEPIKIQQGDMYRMNINIGNQEQSGADMAVLGDITTDTGTDSYSLESRNSLSSFRATSNSNGELWLIVGTDSGYEGVTTLYYTKIGVVLSIVN